MRTERHPNGAVTSVALRLALFLAAGVWFLPAPAAAQVTWTGTTSSNWSTTTNWANSTAPTSGGTGDLFFNASSNVAVTATNNLTSYTASNITFNTGSFTLTGSAVTLSGSVTSTTASTHSINLNLDLGSSDRTFNVASSGNMWIRGTVAGTGGGIVKTGAGTLLLNGTNSFTGNMTVQAGMLRFGGLGTEASSNLFASGTIFLQGSGNLAFGSNQNRDVTTNIVTTGTSSGNGTLNLWNTGTQTIQGNVQVYQLVTSTGALPTTFKNATLTLGGTYATGASTSGTARAEIRPLAAWNVVAVESSTIAPHSGITTSGTLFKTGTGTLSLGTGAILNFNNLSVETGTVAISGAGQLTSTGTYAGNVSGSTSTMFRFDSSAKVTLSGTLSGAGSLLHTGAGTLTLSSSNSYSGGTTLSAGTLEFANGGLGSTGNVTLNGGTLRWATGNTQDISARLALVSGSTATLDTNNNTVTLGNAFIGSSSASLTKTGSATLVINASNTYTGTTTMTAGTLSAGHASALGNGGDITFTGGTLQYTGNIANQDWGNRIKGSSSAIAIDTNSQSVSLGALASSNVGGLTKTGAGTLALTGSNGYTGATTVNAGTLSGVSNALANTSSITVNNGAYLSAVDYKSSASLTLDTTGSAAVSGAGLSLGTVTNNNTTANALDFSSTSGTITLTSLSGAGNTRFRAGASIGGTVSQGSVTIDGVGTLGTVSGGTIALNGGSASITALTGGRIDLANNVALSVQAGTFGGAITGAGSLKKTGSGRLTLTGSQSYTGSTIISGGTVALGAGASLASSPTIVVGDAGSTGAVLDLTAQGGAGKTVTFKADQKVMGKGTIDLAGATLRVLGTLAPGNSPGTLTINGDLQWQSSDAGYQWEINDATGTAGTNWDLLTVSGALDLSHLSASDKFKLDLTTLTSSNTAGLMDNYVDGNKYTWSLVTASSVLLASGTAAAGMDISSLFNVSFANWANPVPSAGNYSVKVASDGAGINLVIIPEPDTIIFAGIGIVMAGWSLWKRRRILQK